MNILITGGAGFIGSNLVENLLNNPKISKVRVLDDFSNGYKKNVDDFLNHPKYEFIEGDICNYDVCIEATKGIDKVSHQAALGSVPRSISNPMRSTEVNILGTVNILHASVTNKVERVVLACSSSTYGDSQFLPKIENIVGKPLSPYAVTKATIETFADVFKNTYGLNYVGLRYFNIFGPRQNPNNPYAAVIPLFCNAFIKNETPSIFGDGLTSRDFTFVQNAVLANNLALFTDDSKALNQIYNIACGEQTNLLDMVGMLSEISGKKILPIFEKERIGDVKHSKADISKARELLGYEPQILFRDGLERVYYWYKGELHNNSIVE
jgi:UDP-N-acetylglucosamine 4-epimerase